MPGPAHLRRHPRARPHHGQRQHGIEQRVGPVLAAEGRQRRRQQGQERTDIEDRAVQRAHIAMPSPPWQAGAARLACGLMASCVALVVAAGRGTRLGAALPKQYLPLAGKPLLRYSLETLARHPAIGAVGVVFNPDDRAHYEAASRGLDLLPPVAGGAARQDSVRLGLDSLASIAARRVLIHGGARPFLDAATIDRVLR